MRSFRYDAHPMSMLISAFACLGSFHPEANPSLQGQKLYTSGVSDAFSPLRGSYLAHYKCITSWTDRGGFADDGQADLPDHRQGSHPSCNGCASFPPHFLYRLLKLADTLALYSLSNSTRSTLQSSPHRHELRRKVLLPIATSILSTGSDSFASIYHPASSTRSTISTSGTILPLLSSPRPLTPSSFFTPITSSTPQRELRSFISLLHPFRFQMS